MIVYVVTSTSASDNRTNVYAAYTDSAMAYTAANDLIEGSLGGFYVSIHSTNLYGAADTGPREVIFHATTD